VATPVAAAHADWRDHVTLTASERARGEVVDFFRPPDDAASSGAHRYSFFGNQLRAGIRALFPHAELVVEGQDTRIVHLPDDASLKAPFGNLGPGAIYFAHTHDRDQGEPFLKQGFLTLRQSGVAATVGRFEYRDGLETLPGNATLLALKRMRIAERLIGPFGYTHVTRSFDGARVAVDRTAWNATAFASHPTMGGFEVSANRELDQVSLAGLALTAKQLPWAGGEPRHLPWATLPIDARLFYLYYEDDRSAATKVDNRPLAARAADKAAIAVHSWGGHVITVVDAGPGAFDLLAWGAFQTGNWGALDHGAWAYALEAGYQLPRVPGAPWLRAGYDRASGDGDPTDGEHRTFFQVMPTARSYAQFPFYNLMNDEDVFVQLLASPWSRVNVRADYHWLRLTDPHDLWYSGGGATNDHVFGFAGIPSGGERELAHVVEGSVEVKLHDRLSAYAYYGHAFGQDVVAATFSGTSASYGYVELTFRY
jgi:alginate export protein